ncbi:hypothetical protein JKY79_03600 [Candidatus Babeliales bacterium]|nr:hypothetical protein [Candidatus Babeliales bacterium]
MNLKKHLIVALFLAFSGISSTYALTSDGDEEALEFPAHLNPEILDSQEFQDLSEEDQEEIAKELFDEFNEWAEEEGYGSDLEELDEEFFAPGEFDEEVETVDEKMKVDSVDDLEDQREDDLRDRREDDSDMAPEDNRKMRHMTGLDSDNKIDKLIERRAVATSLDEDDSFKDASANVVDFKKNQDRFEETRTRSSRGSRSRSRSRRGRVRVGLPQEAQERGIRSRNQRSTVERKAPSSQRRSRGYNRRSGLERKERTASRSRDMSTRTRRTSPVEDALSIKRNEQKEERDAMRANARTRKREEMRAPLLFARDRYLSQ